MARRVSTFPKAVVPSVSGGLPVEVTLLSQLLPGQGSGVIAALARQQAAHPAFVDELDEPSARIGEMDLKHGDPSSLYTFVVGERGHPFHRHAGLRAFVAVTGSGGASLWFSTASREQIRNRPEAFVEAMHVIEVPADSLVAVRFGGGTWHRFMPARPNSRQPALCAVSSHPNELEGGLSPEVLAQVQNNAADIPALTDTLPENVLDWWERAQKGPVRWGSTSLSLRAAPNTWMAQACGVVRTGMGRVMGVLGSRKTQGFEQRGPRPVTSAPPRSRSLLAGLPAGSHDDWFETQLSVDEVLGRSLEAMLSGVLEGFLENHPAGVGRLMEIRNGLVRPLGLRTSSLGCPVSSLLNESSGLRYQERYPVLDKRVEADEVEVLLGADDKHLSFRSVVGVRRESCGGMTCWLATRVKTKNAFGRFYMASIEVVHRRYVSPALLRLAVAHAVEKPGWVACSHGVA